MIYHRREGPQPTTSIPSVCRQPGRSSSKGPCDGLRVLLSQLRAQCLRHLQPWTAGAAWRAQGGASPSLSSTKCQPSCPALEVGLPKPGCSTGHHAVPGHRLARHQHYRSWACARCDREALSLRWNCRTLGDQLSLAPGGPFWQYIQGWHRRGDQTRSGSRIYGSDEDLCARPYYGELPSCQGPGAMRDRRGANLGPHRPQAVSSFIVMGSIWGSWRK